MFVPDEFNVFFASHAGFFQCDLKIKYIPDASETEIEREAGQCVLAKCVANSNAKSVWVLPKTTFRYFYTALAIK